MTFRYIFYHLKALLKKRQTWAVVLTLVFLLFVYGGITFPSVENTYVGVVTFGSEHAKTMIDSLENRSALYTFKEYDSEARLKKDVLSGVLECGFVFDGQYDRLVEKGKVKSSIEYVCSPYTTKGLAAKETLFSAFLDDYSNTIVLKEYSKIFGSKDGEEKDKIINSIEESNQYYKNSDVIFDIESIYY